ncbi:hypothetical protein [Sphingobacterium sp.]|uniref:hypothetical protein n=1 Tax=Sphingobacterium sp. TaxID=341027 RepID=UPI0031DD9FBB
MIKNFIKNERTANITFDDGRRMTLEIVDSEGRIDVEFYEDEEMENQISGATFAFTDESVDVESDEFIPNPNEGERYLLRAMDVPRGFERMGIGRFILEWVIEEYNTIIWARNPFETRLGDGSDLTENGLEFVRAMQASELVDDW